MNITHDEYGILHLLQGVSGHSVALSEQLQILQNMNHAHKEPKIQGVESKEGASLMRTVCKNKSILRQETAGGVVGGP